MQMYHHDSSEDRIYLSFSMDATCRNELHSPWEGYETMVLTPFTPPPNPPTAIAHQCVFPPWAQGQWQNLHISGREIRYTDTKKDKTFNNLCLSQHAPHGERYALYSQTQWFVYLEVNLIFFAIIWSILI